MDYTTACEEFLEALSNLMSCTHGTWAERRDKLLEIAGDTEGAESQLTELASWLEECDD